MRWVLALVAALALAPSAWALERSQFRYERELNASGSATIVFEPDGRMYAHSRPDFADLRILDKAGRQVPWRPAPNWTLGWSVCQ